MIHHDQCSRWSQEYLSEARESWTVSALGRKCCVLAAPSALLWSCPSGQAQRSQRDLGAVSR